MCLPSPKLKPEDAGQIRCARASRLVSYARNPGASRTDLDMLPSLDRARFAVPAESSYNPHDVR
jgi:hypothetical protein